MSVVSIRRACSDDAQPIADFHVKVWRHTYAGLAPAEAFATLDQTYRGRRWRETLAAGDDHQIVLVAEAEGRIVGIGAAGRPSEALYGQRGEIRFLYVDPACQRRGIGRALLSGLARHLQAHGYRGAALGVVKGNDAAIAFYVGLQGRIAGSFIDPGPIWRSENLVYVFDDVAALID